MKILNKKIGNLVSPLMMLGVLVVLLPVFTFMTLDRVKKQEEHIREQLMVKGLSLIRTFEAGTRTGMLTMQWGTQRIQSMLVETAGQPDVAYVMITDARGRIIAHSDADLVGQMYQGWSDLLPLPNESWEVLNRSLRPEGAPVFEVYKKFVPFKSEFNGPRTGHGMHRGRKWGEKDRREHLFFQLEDHYIFAGLSMAKFEEMQQRMTRSIIGRGVFFFFLGCAGIMALFFIQAYRSARASLSRVKAFSDSVVQNMPSGLLTLDAENRITSANRAAGEILGAVPETPYPQMVQLATEVFGSGRVLSREVVLTSDDVGDIRLDMVASPMMDDEDKIRGTILLFRDLTQIKALIKEVETNRRLAAIGKLAGGVAHEIRNPLSSIKGFATYFSRRYEEVPEDAETARIMVQEVERINRSITQLLEFAKPLAVDLRAVELAPLIDHSLKLVAHDLERKHITAQVVIDTEQGVFTTDPDRMNQVLLNLYMNAVNAMSENGQLRVSVTDTEDGIEIRVSDDGCGIPAEDLDTIFDPYFTTRPDGTGLGLSIVHRIVENLKGEIRVESEPGQGTCFILRLPGPGAGTG